MVSDGRCKHAMDRHMHVGGGGGHAYASAIRVLRVHTHRSLGQPFRSCDNTTHAWDVHTQPGGQRGDANIVRTGIEGGLGHTYDKVWV
jgi:hypothetical protein